MSTISIDTTQNVSITYELASVPERIGAYLIDGLIMGATFIFMVFVLSILDARESTDPKAFMIGMAGLTLLIFLYPLIAEATMDGQTLGKRAVGVRVVRLDGSAATIGNFALRYLLGIVENGVFSGAPSLLFILVTKSRQRLGDLAAGTIVVKVPKQASLQLSQLQVQDQPHPTLVFEEVRSLTEEDAAIIREVLRATKTSVYSVDVRTTMLYKAKERIEAMLQIASPMSAEKFLEQILIDYSAYHQAPTSDSVRRPIS